MLFRTVGESKSTLWQSESCHLVLLVFPSDFFLFVLFLPPLDIVTLVSCSPDVGVPPHSFPNLFFVVISGDKVVLCVSALVL